MNSSFTKFIAASHAYYAAFVAFAEIAQVLGEDARECVVGARGETVEARVERACAFVERDDVRRAIGAVTNAVIEGWRDTDARSGDDASAKEEDGGKRGDNLMESVVDVLCAPRRLNAIGGFVRETAKGVMEACVSVAKENAEVVKALTGIGEGTRASATERAVAFLEEPERKKLALEIGASIVDAAVTTYVRETRDVNSYADMFASVREPSNRELFLDFMSAVVETSVRTYVTAAAATYREEREAPMKRRLNESPTSPLETNSYASRSPASTPLAGEREEIPVLVGNWKELFRAATLNRENRRLVLATVATTTKATLTGLATGMYDVLVRGRVGHRILALEYYALAVVFAMASVLIVLLTRILAVLTIASTPT